MCVCVCACVCVCVCVHSPLVNESRTPLLISTLVTAFLEVVGLPNDLQHTSETQKNKRTRQTNKQTDKQTDNKTKVLKADESHISTERLFNSE